MLLLVQRQHIENQLLYEKGVGIVVGGWSSKWKTSWWINIEYRLMNVCIYIYIWVRVEMSKKLHYISVYIFQFITS